MKIALEKGMRQRSLTVFLCFLVGGSVAAVEQAIWPDTVIAHGGRNRQVRMPQSAFERYLPLPQRSISRPVLSESGRNAEGPVFSHGPAARSEVITTAHPYAINPVRPRPVSSLD